MGNTESRQKTGERVAAAKQELKEQHDAAQKQIQFWDSKDSILVKLVNNLEELINKRSEIPNNLLFYCWHANSVV